MHDVIVLSENKRQVRHSVARLYSFSSD